MKVTTYTVFDILSRLRASFKGRNAARHIEKNEPFRSELYSSDQMDRHGKIVAASHKVKMQRGNDHLLKRLDDNEKSLLEVRNVLVESLRARNTISPGAEWLLDNFYLVEEQIVIARKHLPKGYSEGLPSLVDGISSGLPRVYDIVLEIISHSDGRVDAKSLSRFISSYQTHTTLTLGELWAIPIMLRLAVIENLRRVSGKIALDIIDHNLADYWADKLMSTLTEEPGNLILTLADMARSNPELTCSFVAGFTRKLQGKGPSLALPLSWMEQQLSTLGTGSNDMVRQENQKQAADQVSVSNSIGTLRFLGAMDWREFVETLSSVEQVLRQDTTGTYPQMDFSTRDRYRHVVEVIAKASPFTETEVAKIALKLATDSKNRNPGHNRANHIGYHLVDKGLRNTQKVSEMQFTVKQKLVLACKKYPVFLYLFSLGFITVSVAGTMCFLAYYYGDFGWQVLCLLALVSLSGAAQFASSLVNWVSTLWVSPKLLPRMDFSKGIPAEYRTLIVIPTMLSGTAYIEEMLDGLEIRYIANKEKNLYFGLLTDFTDATTEVVANDAELLKQVRTGIEALNQKYTGDGDDIFFLFHRSRTWNANEKKWMGYERKRGKLSALNALLCGRSQNEFSCITGNYRILTNMKYVITLDSDTQLPRDAAWKFIATMAHPLNHAIFDREKKRVVEGYGILQPRMASSIPTTPASLYLKMLGQVSGIDPYTRVSSDVYQDLFSEGSFIGKGIYDVEIFEQAVNQIFPENRILSHDLIEGCYTRSGLLSDVHLYEEGPPQYSADIKRHHRWIRGDWQIASWIFPFIRATNGKIIPNPLSVISRHKIFDNLRRSLLPLSLMCLLLMGWFVLPFAWFWTLAVSTIILLPLMAAAGWQLLNKPDDINYKTHISEVGLSVRDLLIRFTFGLAVLPYEAYIYTDAVIRTNWRILVSKKNLLEWTPSASAARKGINSMWTAYDTMWVAPVMAFLCTVLLLYRFPETLPVAAPFLILWLSAPAIAWRISITAKEETPALDADQTIFLHKTALKTWTFFEQFVTDEENWLPPDNYQEQPVAVIANRTSPTNMGLALLANLSAYDFGYITATEMILRCKNTLNTMLTMERYKGHFYNWYDTRTMSPLHPKYVSTVDSGNLTAHLLTLKQGLLNLDKEPVFNSKAYQGMLTNARIVKELAGETENLTLDNIIALLAKAESQSARSLTEVKLRLDELHHLITELINQTPHTEIQPYKWTLRLYKQINDTRQDLLQQLPWLELFPVPESFANLKSLDRIPTWHGINVLTQAYIKHIESYATEETRPEEKRWMNEMALALAKGKIIADKHILVSELLAENCEALSDVSYGFLLDKGTYLLSIGYNIDEQRRDPGYYDLLASEARLGIFVAIAQGKLPQDSWFALGRLLTNSGSGAILLSWSGSMFEYLMPQLVMPSYENTLIHQTSAATVRRQIEYAKQRGVPWGISESGYNMVDAAMNYQYKAFGVPGLGLKRGLDEDTVIAPYATMMALMVSPEKACINLQTMAESGFEGEYGFYEAIDYTPSRVPRGKDYAIVQSYMVHHQGMGLLSLAYLLLGKPMQTRFVSELRFQATLLLLQERIPRTTLFYAHTADIIETHTETNEVQLRSVNTANTVNPEIQLLSNGRYQLMITNSGGSYSRWKDIALTRWREDATMDNHGIFCYIKDVDSGLFWSNTYQPTLMRARFYEAIFSQGQVEFRRQDHGIETKTEILISPEDDAELRRIRISNRTQSLRVLEITSYAEIVLASQASDESHPAFSNLFVQTEIRKEHSAIFGARRARSENENPPWMFHLMEVNGATAEAISFETDRMEFIGRGRSLANPQAMNQPTLSGKHGSVLDPVMAIRYRISLKPGQTATIDMIFGIAETRMACESLMHKYKDQHLKKRAIELSWTHSQVLLRQINATESEAQLYDRMAASVIYANSNLRAEAIVISNNYRGQSGLWSHSVSGDLPIVLVHIYDAENIELVRQMIQAHAYWRMKGLAVDLVIWNEDHGSYRQLLQEEILGLITQEAGSQPTSYSKPGNIFVKSADQLSSEDRILFESVARIVIHDNKGTLSEQINGHKQERALPPLLEQSVIAPEESENPLALPHDLLFHNGTGGFTPDGKEYKILVNKNTKTPAPWVNVLANPNFGTVVSESGSAYTWAINAHEYRITPWSNDPVKDIGGEAFYLRNEENGHTWSPTPFPMGGTTPYIVTHGFGYTEYEHSEKGVISSMKVFVDKDLPVKFIVLKIKNESGREQKFSATGFMEIILGDVRSKTNMHIISEKDENSGALLFKNRYNSAFAERVAFFKVAESNVTYTADRAEFIGRNSSLADPKAMSRKKLSGRLGAGIDTCAALQVKFELLAGAEKEIIFQLGNGDNRNHVNEIIRQFTDRTQVMESLENVKAFWKNTLDAVQVKTPDISLNILTNGWLTYQTLASRIYARSGFYQSGGAFGFRDQLQDVLSLMHTKPELARNQIIMNASRQFSEGDVQHWWHPPEGRGVRTRCSDDLLWLPFAVSRYIETTGDHAILNTEVGFLDSRLLHAGEESLYDLPISGILSGTVYEHCKRAITLSLKFGKNGLPFIGAGDWNDGMDQVGHKGHGESVWLAFFMFEILNQFAGNAESFGDNTFAEECREQAIKLQQNIETSGWDGEWYLRAFFDNGAALGSSENEECRIDAIAQSWSVLSGAGSKERQNTAMASLDKFLVRRDLKLIQLLDPPFDSNGPNPGYIRGYVPGVRENGGQYSHAAVWAMMAFAKLQNRERVYELFNMVNPVNHALNSETKEVYKVEPYVMAADVYANKSHEGRGGWTWYTGSAGWMYQFILGSMLGMDLKKDQLHFNPCFPLEWPSVLISYKFGSSTFHITVFQHTDQTESWWSLDGNKGNGNHFTLNDDGLEHHAEVHVNNNLEG